MTDRSQTNSVLEDSEEHLRSILDTAIDGIILINDRGIVEAFSQSAERIFGYSADEVIGRNVSMLMPDPYKSAHDQFMANYHETGQRKIIGIGRVVVGRRKDGTTFPMELAVGETPTVHGRRYTGFVRDITQRQEDRQRVQELQNELAHTSRLNAMGEMASSMAHELNQPLTAISNYVQACRRLIEAAPEGTERLPDLLGKIFDQARRASEIITRLRKFISKGELVIQEVDLNEAVEEAVGLALIGTAEVNVSIDMELAPDLPSLQVDRIQIQQVVLNLVRNAVEAMEGADIRRLTITTDRRDDDGNGTGECLLVEIADTGPGFPAEFRGQMFRPFHTTKETGMGLGLSICKTLVEAHGGALAMPEVEAGGLVRFCLPLSRSDDGPGKAP